MLFSMVANLAPKRVGIVGFAGVTALHLSSTADVFAAAALDDGYGNRLPCYEVCVIGLTPAPFRAESGITFRPQNTLRTAPEFDTIVIPGGSGLCDSATSLTLADWLKKRADRTRRIATLCTGLYALAPTGLLDGRAATTHWRVARDIAQRFPKIRVQHQQRMISDDPFYSAAGLTAGIDLSRALVEDDFGPQVARLVERELVMYFECSSFTEEAAERAYFQDQAQDRFAALVAWMLRHLDEDLSVAALARKACMCQDTFSRAFKSVFGAAPSTFVENLRLNEARRRLSTRRRTVHSVAESVGFKSADRFGRAFERRFGVKPLASAEVSSAR